MLSAATETNLAVMDREQIIDELFAHAIELRPDQREKFFADSKAHNGGSSDDHVLAEVRSLVRDFEFAEAAGFLDRPLLVAEGPTLVDGQTFEGYKIINLIAEGGMGEVYLAHDPELDRKVAIKLIKSHLKTRELLRRFRNERQILANLQHPNIARLLGAGATTEGLPFCVMEYVEGKPIDIYADEKRLTLTERLQLFRTVCSAITCAHQNLVIHRDIKPSNILVTTDGQPKLLDFGIAKVLHETDLPDAPVTVFQAMTPEYASPEQINGGPITTASDVYSLGALLCELLTGSRPYKLKRRAADEMTRAISEQEPSKPSALLTDARLRSTGSETTHTGVDNPKSLRGDLDNIVLKALRKEPERRYLSVEQLSEDIRRHLDGLPVSARKDTFTYRTSKFILRNKISVAAALLVVFTVLVAFAATAWEAHVARAERAKSERRFNDVRSLVNSLLFQLHDEIEKLPGSTKARELLVMQTVSYLDSVAKEASGDTSFQQEIATGYEKLGDVQSRLNGPNLGDTKGALQSYQKALEIRKAIFAANPKEVSNRLALALAYDRIGEMMSKTNNARAALDSHRQSLELAQKLPNNDQSAVRSVLAYSHVMVGRAHLALGDLPAALEHFRQSQMIRESLAAEDPRDEKQRRSLITSYDGIAFVLSLNGKPNEALDYYRKSQAIVEELAANNPNNADYRRALMDTYEWIGITFGEIGDNATGLEYHKKALAICRAQLAADPANVQAHNDLGDVYHEIGNRLMRLGKINEALNAFRNSLENYRAVSEADPTDKNARRQVYLTYRETGNALMMAGNPSAAMDDYTKALVAFRELAEDDPDNAETQLYLAVTYRNIGEALMRTRKIVEAIENYQQALPVFEALSAHSPANAKTKAELALAYYDLAQSMTAHAFASSDSGNYRNACTYFQQSLKIWIELKNNGTLPSVHANKPEDLLKETAKCDAIKK